METVLLIYSKSRRIYAQKRPGARKELKFELRRTYWYVEDFQRSPTQHIATMVEEFTLKNAQVQGRTYYLS